MSLTGVLQSTDPAVILWTAAAHLALVVFLYSWLTLERFLNAKGGRAAYSDLDLPGGDRGRAARIAANLNNQFQAPVFFHVLVLTLWATGEVQGLDILLAWVFFVGRVLHTLVQTLSGNVLLRGAVFSINFLALAGMWISFLAQQLA